MKTYKVYQVDAFTKVKFTGNPAGVVMNADGLSDKDMQNIARELNNSETAFIFKGKEGFYDMHTRYFTPTKEVPICGHATIASQYVYAMEMGYSDITLLNKTGAGILPVAIQRTEGDYKITMTQGEIVFGEVISGERRKELLSALDLSEADMIEGLEIQIVSTGHSKVLIGIKSESLLNQLSPDMVELSKLSNLIGCNGYYVFVIDKEDKNHLVKGRMFAPAIGINEDPVTGNANGPLGAYLIKYKMVEGVSNPFVFKAQQGVAMGRPGIIEVQVSHNNGAPKQVKIKGEAVVVFETELTL